MAWARGRSFAAKYVVAASGIYGGLAYWLISAPDMRFGCAWIVAGLALPLSCFASLILQRMSRQIATAMLTLALVCIALVFVAGTARFVGQSGTPPNLVTLTPLTHGETVPFTLAGGLVVNVPANRSQQAWNAPLPGAPGPPSTLVLRGPGLGDGFRQ